MKDMHLQNQRMKRFRELLNFYNILKNYTVILGCFNPLNLQKKVCSHCLDLQLSTHGLKISRINRWRNVGTLLFLVMA